MGAALFGVDAIGERIHRLGEAVVVLDCHLDGCFIHHLLEIEGAGLHGAAVTVDVSDQVGDAAVEEVGPFDIALAPFQMPAPRTGDRSA